MREEAVPLSWPDRPSMRVITAFWQNFVAFLHVLLLLVAQGVAEFRRAWQ